MLDATFYTFSKRDNSTLLPTAVLPHYSMQININDNNSSLRAPLIRVAMPAGVSLLVYNYVYIQQFARYYYITDWSYNADGTWSAACAEDVLSSWRTAIINSGGYVGRSSRYFDSAIVDDLYPPENFPVVVKDSQITHMNAYIGQLSTFIVGIISSVNHSVGVVGYYILTKQQLSALCNKLMSNTTEDWDDVTTMSPDVLKSFIDPLQFIVSCKWFPFDDTAIFNSTDYTTVNDISVYGWSTGVSGKFIGSKTYYDFPKVDGNGNNVYYTIDVYDLDHHFPNGLTINGQTRAIDLAEYPKISPYARYTLIAPWGEFELDSTIISNMFDYYRNNLGAIMIGWKMYIDIVTGLATFVVKGANGNSMEDYEFFRKEIQLAIDVPLSQATYNYLSIATTKVDAYSHSADAGRAAFGLDLQGVAKAGSNIKKDMYNLASAMLSPSLQSTDSKPASFTRTIENIGVQQVRYKTVGQSNTAFGKPLKKYYAALTDFVGYYVQMDYSAFASNCLADERQAIVAYLESGVYIE